MTLTEMIALGIGLAIGGSGIYLLGHSLIEAYFRRKEKFVDSLQEKMKGGSNGSV